MTQIESECKNIVRAKNSTKYEVRFCWTCGHYAECNENRCGCCGHRIATKKPKGEILLEIKINLEEIMQGKKEPEYRFHTKDGVYWVKLSTLQQLEKLPLDQKNEKYFHWLNKIRDSGELAFIAKF